MLFYTTATVGMLEQARLLGETLKQHNSDAKFYLLLCDAQPADFPGKDEPFDGVLLSRDITLSNDISTVFWHYLHSPEALCAAVKPMGALLLKEVTGAEKIIYLAPNTSVTENLDSLNQLLDQHDIVLAPHPAILDSDFNTLQGAYHPGFFAVNTNNNGTEFLNYWKQAAERLYMTAAVLDADAYNRLQDMAPALSAKVCVLRDANLPLADTADTGIPCIYSFYANGEPVTVEDRMQVRADAELMNAYKHTDPVITEGADTLYRTLRTRSAETTSNDGLYWEEYQEILNSTSYRVGKKLVDLADRILPKQLFNKLRGVQPAQANLPEADAAVPVEVVPLSVPQAATPLFSIILSDCKDFTESYTAIHSILTTNPDVSLELLVSTKLPEADRTRLEQTVSGLRVVETNVLSELLHAAKGSYALLMDEHLTIEDGFFAAALDRIEETGSSILQTRITYSDGKLYEAGGVLLQNGRRISYGCGTKAQLGCVRYDKEVDCVSLRGTIIDLNVLRKFGLDDTMSSIYALADLSFKLRENGLKTMYVYHPQLHDRRSWDISMQPAAPAADAYAFAQKWKDTLLRENISDPSELFLGRDRSKNKKTIFAVDNTIPMYDISAGDRNTYQYYETMADMGYNLKIVGDDYMRQEPYASYLEAQGIEVVAADGGGEVEYRTFLRDNGRFIDAAYLNRPNNLAKYAPAIQKYTDARIVYCCHDLHFLRELREHELNGNKKEAQRVREYAKEEIARMDIADVIFDVSAYEKSILDPHLKHARVEVNPIFIYREFPEFMENFDQRKDLLFVGSFKHPANLDGVDWLCKEIMPVVLQAMPDVKLHLVGAHPTPEIKALANDNIIVHGFLTDDELADMYRSCRLSIVPLRFGAGVKGKVLEAMYHGLPIVSTSIGTEGIVDIEQCIENTDGTEAFANKVIELYPDIEKLTKMGRNNWRYVQDHLGVEPAQELFRRSF